MNAWKEMGKFSVLLAVGTLLIKIVKKIEKNTILASILLRGRNND